MVDSPSLVELVVDVHDRLDEGAIPHGFGGAIALAYYVKEPRATRDVDLNVATSLAHAEEVFRLMPPSVNWNETDLRECLARGQIRLWSGERRTGIPVDLFFPQHEFHDVVASETTDKPFAREDYLIPVIKASHLVVFKSLFNRPKDWIDIEAMLGAGTVDVADALHWVWVLLGEEHSTFRRLAATIASSLTAPSPGQGHETDLPTIDWSGLGN